MVGRPDGQRRMVSDHNSSLSTPCSGELMTPNLKFVFGRVENIVGQGENAGNQHFLLFLQCFPKTSYTGSLKVEIVW